MEAAIEFVVKTSANMGGTDINKAFLSAVAKKCTPSYSRSIFILTDGAVYYPEVIINSVKKHAHNTCVHTFGIGSGVSRTLVEGCAIAGNGTYQFATANESIAPKVISSLAKATMPACTDVKVTWPETVNVELQSPAKDRMPNVYMKEPFIVMALISGEIEGKVKLQFQDTATHKLVNLEVALPKEVVDGKDIYQATVKNSFEYDVRLTVAKTVELSMKYSVLSKSTAFFAVQKNKDKALGAMKKVEVPIAITKDTIKLRKTSKTKSTSTFICSDHIESRKLLCKSKRLCVFAEKTAYKGKTLSRKFSTKHNEGEYDDFEEEIPMNESLNKSLKIVECIINLQEIYGNWNWNANTFKAINLNEGKADKSIPKELQDIVSDEKTLLEAWITILALAKLERDNEDSKEAW